MLVGWHDGSPEYFQYLRAMAPGHRLLGIKVMKSAICYLCGKPGANSKDHVPPKGLLPEAQYGQYQRITVPAHRDCNSASSEDEEYVRDLLVMEAEALGLPKHENLTPRVWRSWARPGGVKRYQTIVNTAVPVHLKTQSGIYAGKAIGVRPDVERIKSVGRKIVQGMIYHDAAAIIDVSHMPIGVCGKGDIDELKARDAHEPFWKGLSSVQCRHDMCADTVAIRRFYEGVPCGDDVVIVASFFIVLWNCVMLAYLEFPLDAIGKKDFTFSINTVDVWQHACDATGP